MGYPDISGAWLSEGNLVYIITQLEDKFVWKVVHKNGVIETGIGWFPKNNEPRHVEAQWNFHEGKLGQGIKPRKGKIITPCTGKIVNKGKKNQILWGDGDHFMERIPKG